MDYYCPRVLTAKGKGIIVPKISDLVPCCAPPVFSRIPGWAELRRVGSGGLIVPTFKAWAGISGGQFLAKSLCGYAHVCSYFLSNE